MEAGKEGLKVSRKEGWKYVVLAVAMLLLIVSVVQAYQIAALGKAGSPEGVIDTSGWTADEKMNYEMHGIIPSVKGSAASSAGGMVGGC